MSIWITVGVCPMAGTDAMVANANAVQMLPSVLWNMLPSILSSGRPEDKMEGSMFHKTLGSIWTAFALATIASVPAIGQTPTVIQIDIENYAYYYADNPDYSKLAGSVQAVP